MRTSVLLVVVFATVAAYAVLPLEVYKKIATMGAAPAKCCIPSKVFSAQKAEVAASWDVKGSESGYHYVELQADQTNMLFYAHEDRVSPSPAFEQLQIWMTPAAVQGQWFEFFKFQNSPDCYVRNVSVKPDIFNPICYGEPFVYGGAVVLGTQMVDLWNEAATPHYNESHFVSQAACIPVFTLGLGINAAGDFEERLSNVFNVAWKINDPSKFIPPTQCRPLATASAEMLGRAEEMSRRHTSSLTRLF